MGAVDDLARCRANLRAARRDVKRLEADRDRYREDYRVESIACHDAQVQRDYLLAERDRLRGVCDAAEAFLDYKCNCATLADQGCICSVCLLKERFAALAPEEEPAPTQAELRARVDAMSPEERTAFVGRFEALCEHVDTHAICPVCGQEVGIKDGLLAYHDDPPPCRRVCPGSKRSVPEPPPDACTCRHARAEHCAQGCCDHYGCACRGYEAAKENP